MTAPFHAAAGNNQHAVQAAVSGFGTMAGFVVGGPAGAYAAGGTQAILSGVVSDYVQPEKVVERVVANTGSAQIARVFDESHLNQQKKEEALRKKRKNDNMEAARILLKAMFEKVRKNARDLSAEAGGRRILKSVHGTFLRAVEPEWRVDMVRSAPREWEHWYLEDWGGQVKEERERERERDREREREG